jgi:hypothetical protein
VFEKELIEKYEKALKIMASGWIFKPKSDEYCIDCDYFQKPHAGCNGSPEDCMHHLIDWSKKQAGIDDKNV